MKVGKGQQEVPLPAHPRDLVKVIRASRNAWHRSKNRKITTESASSRLVERILLWRRADLRMMARKSWSEAQYVEAAKRQVKTSHKIRVDKNSFTWSRPRGVAGYTETHTAGAAVMPASPLESLTPCSLHDCQDE
jgi:hypothetical protein